MSLTQLTADLNIIQTLIDEPNDVGGLTAAQLKAKFDEASNAIKDYINDVLLVELASVTDSSSGSDKIGATGVTDLDGATVQALIESLRNKLKSTTDGSSGADFVKSTAISGLSGDTIQSLLESLKSLVDTNNTNRTNDLNTHKDSNDHDERYYTESESDAKFVTITDITNNRKLSASGDFTGTLNGMTIVAADPGLSSTVAYHTEQLADNAQQINAIKNNQTVQYVGLKGINYWIGDMNSTKTQSELDGVLDSIKASGFTHIFLVVYLNQTDGNTGNTIVQVQTDQFILDNINHAKAIGLTVKGVKVHLGGITNSTSLAPSNVITWFTNYKSALMHIANLCLSQSIEYFGISNERTDMTSVLGNVSSWQDIITSVKALGYKVMCTCTYDEANVSQILSLVDAIGVNMYPHMSNGGTSATLTECLQAWQYDLTSREYLRLLKRLKTKYSKPIFVSETGCTNIATGLANPENWNLGVYTADYTAMNLYYSATLRALSEKSYIDGVFLWDSTTTMYSPLRDSTVLNTIKAFMGVV